MQITPKIIEGLIWNCHWWCRKSSVSHTILTCSRQNLHNTEIEGLAKSTSVVLAKYFPKVKLENFFHNSKVSELGWIIRTLSLRALGFYSSVELTFVSCLEKCFLMRKIFINACILQDCSHFRIPLTKVNRGVQDISI